MSWTILIVDDAHSIRTQLRVALEAKGVRVLEAENGSEGLWRAREHGIDLILTDVHMPVMDGVRMIQEVRKLSVYAHTPIFVLTSDATSSRVQEGRSAGANAWLLKPVNAEQLWKAIQKALLAAPRPVSTQATEAEKGSQR